MAFSSMPLSLSFNYNVGISLLVTMVCLVVTGLLSVFFYSPSLDTAFSLLVANESYFHGLLRVFHNNLANLLFVFLFAHIVRSWFLSNSSHTFVLLTGLAIFFLACGVAFLGYCLPIGQLSFWACIVILNLLTVLPYGTTLVIAILGDYSICSRTVGLFLTLHYLLPFAVLGLVVLHFHFLHSTLSAQGLDSYNTSFTPYFLNLDVFVVCLFFLFLSVFVLRSHFYFFESVNWVHWSSTTTPTHIKPDWFFLFAYACLRAVDSKLVGVLYMVAILLLLFVPYVFSPWPYNQLAGCFFLASYLCLFFWGNSVVFATFNCLILAVTFAILATVLFFLVYLAIREMALNENFSLSTKCY